MANAAVIRQKLQSARKNLNRYLEKHRVTGHGGLTEALYDVLDILEEVLEDAEADEWHADALEHMTPEGD